MRRRLIPIALAAVVVFHGVPAVAHTARTRDTAYRSVVTGIAPAGTFTVAVLDRDDRLQLTLTGTRDLIVLGYQHEPYLRFTAAGVFRNQRSPATYLNDDRLGQVVVPATADPKAPPQWTKVAAGTSYQWHDHRIHWMGTTPPAAIRDHPGQARRVFTWTVPLVVGAAAGKIDGELDYRPRTAANPWPVRLLGGGAVLLVGIASAAGLGFRQRRRLRRS